MHVCVYAIRGLERCPFGSICKIKRLDVTQSTQSYLHCVNEILRDVKSYLFTLIESATIPELNQGLGTDIHWTPPLKVYLKCVHKEDRPDHSENICKGMDAGTDRFFPSPFTPYVSSWEQTLFTFAESINHQLHTVYWHVVFPSATTNKSTNKSTSFGHLLSPFNFFGNVTFYCCRNVFLDDLTHPQSQLLGSHRFK